MAKIKVRRLKMVNFKGIRELDIELNDTFTTVKGRNGSGKTTIFDAFTWVLFGKDSIGRKQFEIRTLDQNGDVITRLPHEVSATLQVDGTLVILTRRFTEKWQKRRGTATEVYVGNEVERLFNDVPCSEKEFDAKVAEICAPEVFKMITSPMYFTSLKADQQRAMLIRMIGGFSDNDVIKASGNEPKFIDLLQRLMGKTIEEYRREVGAKKKRVKVELDALPERIDERKRDSATYADVDFDEVQAEFENKNGQLRDIETQFTDLTEHERAADLELNRLRQQLSRNKSEQFEVRTKVQNEASKAYSEVQWKKEQLLHSINHAARKVDKCRAEVVDAEHDYEIACAERERCIAEWRQIQAEQLTFGENDFNCPTCGRPFDLADIEQKRQEMTQAFNARKAARLEANKQRGLKCSKTVLASLLDAVTTATKNAADAKEECEKLNEQYSTFETPHQPTAEQITETLQKNPDYQQLIEQEKALRAQIDARANNTANPDLEELRLARKTLADNVMELSGILAKREITERNANRIQELEEQVRTLGAQLAELEQIEFTMDAFCKARIEAVESRINALFTNVRFKMYDRQINGGEVETCEATVDGVPYSSLNNAGRINAGLDIINAICKHEGISAPIFVDNAEAVNKLLPTESQIIALAVTEDEQLTIV